jgi:hypothetical protein
VLSIIAAIGVLLLVLATGSFVLDILELRQLVRPDERTSLLVAGSQALLKMGLVASVGSLLALGTWKAGRSSARHHQQEAGVVFSSPQGSD